MHFPDGDWDKDFMTLVFKMTTVISGICFLIVVLWGVYNLVVSLIKT